MLSRWQLSLILFFVGLFGWRRAHWTFLMSTRGASLSWSGSSRTSHSVTVPVMISSLSLISLLLHFSSEVVILSV